MIETPQVLRRLLGDRWSRKNLPPTRQPLLEDSPAAAHRCELAVDLLGQTFQAEKRSGQVHALGSTLYWDVPAGKEVVLFTGGSPTSAALPPCRDAAIVGLFIEADVEGHLPRFFLITYDDRRGALPVNGVFKSNRLRLTIPAHEPLAQRACIALAGQGALRCRALRLIYQRPKDQSADATGNRLYDIVKSDFDAARKAGAEIPPPPLA